MSQKPKLPVGIEPPFHCGKPDDDGERFVYDKNGNGMGGLISQVSAQAVCYALNLAYPVRRKKAKGAKHAR